MKSVFIVIIVAIIAYFLFRPTTFTVQNDIFVYKLPEDVYEFMSDLKRTIEKHSIGGKCTLMKQRTRKDGMREKLYLVEKAVALFWDYELPLNMEIRLTLTKPSEELRYNFNFARGYLLKVSSRITFERREGRVLPGTFLTENLTVTCPWLAQAVVSKSLEESHKDTLISLRNGLEGMPLPKDKTNKMREEMEDRQEERKMRTEKNKEEGTSDKKDKPRKKDEAKKPSDGQEKNISKKEKRATADKDKEKPQSEDAKQKTVEKGKMKDSQAEKQAPTGKQPTADKKAERGTSQDAKEKPKQAKKDEKVKTTETRKEERQAENVKREEDGAKEIKDAEEAKRERKIERNEQVTKKTSDSGKEGAMGEKSVESENRKAPKEEREKIVNSGKSEQKQKAKTGG
ncbi:transcriptional regulator ATRX homolog [Acanthaster planci]|uniref:Transcriptional regulator ATRX homolog n=1 Tax=Acanthaster planci TaxID=133434 RepID=A0A8B7Y2B8_ACAPL|nr:transcriptional regulator ATRX homolog [Acanthaster planci]